MIVVLPQIIAKSFSAVTIYPFIFLKNDKHKTDYVLINHERIHMEQQKELFWIGFFVWYFVEYFIKLMYYRNSYLAYTQISFEREAYCYEDDLDYNNNRKHFHFIKYLIR